MPCSSKQNMTTPPPILYKYFDAEGAIKTLGNLSIKFSSPLSLNDPFEGLYGDISDANKEEVHKMLLRAKYSKNEWVRICETRLGISQEKALLGFELVDSEDLRWFEYWFEQVYQVFVDTMHRCFGELRSDILVFKAITCFSANWSNLLMWGHYADKHRGCVIGFDTEKLSSQVGTPLQVKYPYDNRRVPMPTTVNTYYDSQRATDTIITKPREWSYEEESISETPS